MALGTVVALNATTYGVWGEGGRLAPGGMPFLAGIVTAIFALGVIVSAIVGARRSGQGEGTRASRRDAPLGDGQQAVGGGVPSRDEGSGDNGVTNHDRSTAAGTQDEAVNVSPGKTSPGETSQGDGTSLLRSMTVFVSLIFAVIVLTPFVGLLVALGLFVFFILAVVERQSLSLSILLAAVVTTISYLLFVTFLGVPLTSGRLF